MKISDQTNPTYQSWANTDMTSWRALQEINFLDSDINSYFDTFIRQSSVNFVDFTNVSTQKDNNQMAGNLNGNQNKTTKSEFGKTSAELQVYNFYRIKGKESPEAADKERSWFKIHSRYIDMLIFYF